MRKLSDPAETRDTAETLSPPPCPASWETNQLTTPRSPDSSPFLQDRTGKLGVGIVGDKSGDFLSLIMSLYANYLNLSKHEILQKPFLLLHVLIR